MIGDVLVSSIICNNIKKAFPDAQVDYMVYASTVEVLNGNPYIDNIIEFTEEHRNSKLKFYKLIKCLKRENYNLVIDSYSKLESWITVFFLKKSRRISFKKPGRTFLYTDVVDFQEIPNSNLGLIIERRLSLLNPLNLSIDIEPIPKLYVTDEEKQFADKLFKTNVIDCTKKTVMISLLGSSENKTFPFAQMSKIIDFIVNQIDANILFNYFPKQIAEAKEIYDACGEDTKRNIYFDVLGNSLREFIAIMDMCDMIVGNDGGAINMAKALNKPSFTIFSPWIEKRMWSTFEDGKFHNSVHLKDFLPEIFVDKTQKQLKNQSIEIYKKFEFNFFKDQLKTFLTSEKSNMPELDKTRYTQKVKLSVLAITFNEVDNINDLIASVSFADEIIVVDSFSIDGTYEELLKYPQVKVIQRAFDNFSSQRNFAALQASNDWVLFVDADERLSENLKKEILDSINSPNGVVTFGMYRKLFLNGKQLKFGGFQSEKVYRLYHRKYATYNSEKLVHETLLVNGKTKLLKNEVVHYSYDTEEKFKEKLRFYASLRAIELKNKGVRSNWYYYYIKPIYRFFHMYFIRFGFMDGKNGYKIARLQSYGVRQRYVELNKLYAEKL